MEKEFKIIANDLNRDITIPKEIIERIKEIKTFAHKTENWVIIDETCADCMEGKPEEPYRLILLDAQFNNQKIMCLYTIEILDENNIMSHLSISKKESVVWPGQYMALVAAFFDQQESNNNLQAIGSPYGVAHYFRPFNRYLKG